MSDSGGRVVCAECVKEDVRSTTIPIVGDSTGASWEPFWDENGIGHIHDQYGTWSGRRCSNGHEWCVHMLQPCPSCDWSRDG